MASRGGGDDGGQPPPILVLTLTADPRGPANEWTCHLGPQEGQNAINGPWGDAISTTEVGGVLAKIAGSGYRLQSSLSFGLSSVSGHENDVTAISGGRRMPSDKASLLVRSKTAYNNVLQHVFQREEPQRAREGVGEGMQQGLQANQAQLSSLHAELRAERARHEEEIRSLRASLDRERRDRLEALAVKDRELAALRRGMMEGAGALAASIAVREEQQEEGRRPLDDLSTQQPACEPEPPAAVVEEEPQPERLIAEGDVVGGPAAQEHPRALAEEDEEEAALAAQQQQQAELAAALAAHPHEAAGAQRGPREGGSGGVIVEADIPMEGCIWRDLDQVLCEPLPNNVYCTPAKRTSSSARPTEDECFAVPMGAARPGPTPPSARSALGSWAKREPQRPVRASLPAHGAGLTPAPCAAGGGGGAQGGGRGGPSKLRAAQADGNSQHVFLGRSLWYGQERGPPQPSHGPPLGEGDDGLRRRL